ncbi:MAG: GSCFA domain-containing protein [Chthoniobacterales bacterium]
MNCETTAIPLREKLFKVHQVGSQEELQFAAGSDPISAGKQYLEKKDIHNACEAFRIAVNQDPNSFEANFLLGTALFQEERWTEAEPFFRRATELKPDSREAREWQGNNYVKMGCFASGEETLRKSLSRSSLRDKIRNFLDIWWHPERFNGAVTDNPNSTSVETQLRYAKSRSATLEYANKCFRIGKPNIIWRKSARGRAFGVRPEPIISKDSRIFTMGSCFAVEIRDALTRRGFQVYPKYAGIQFDETRCIANLLPDSENINHYDTFTIRQEFENAFAGKHFPESSFWKVEGAPINKSLGTDVVWQDPHRRNVFALDFKDLVDISQKIDNCVREGIEKADVYVITLGLIETWRNQKDPQYHACSYPGAGGGGKAADFHLSSFQDDYENIKRVCELIFAKYPDKHVLLTVSPVSLERTFRDWDVVLANMESKAQLRTVAGHLHREFPNVHYLPSFEAFIYHDLYHDDGRHASRDAVELIIERFSKLFLVQEEDASKSK